MTLIYGHRGAKGEAPENTLPSFQRCLEHGVTRCELDLHLSRDGELMVIHDPTLKRTTGRRGKVSEQLAEDLVTYDARQGGPGWVRPCPIPRLAELFERCEFEHWQLEVKSASRERASKTTKPPHNARLRSNGVRAEKCCAGVSVTGSGASPACSHQSSSSMRRNPARRPRRPFPIGVTRSGSNRRCKYRRLARSQWS